MKVSVDLDLKPFLRAVTGDPNARPSEISDKAKRKLAYATANAINWSALYVQADAIANVNRTFTIRTSASRKLLERQAAILKPRASVGASRFFAELYVGGRDLQSRTPLLLAEFELGAQRKPFTPGAKRVAVPITGGARPSFGATVTASLLISRLALKPKFSKSVGRNVSRLARSATSSSVRRALISTLGAGQVWQGKFGTYMIPRIGIFQRTGAGPRGRILYSFESDVRLPARLRFLALAQRNGGRYLERELVREVTAIIEGRRTNAAPNRLP